MRENIGVIWLREDFRLLRNYALINANKNHKKLIAVYAYKEKKFIDKKGQKWWVYKSLKNFKKDLDDYNITLQVIKTDTYKSFFEKLIKIKNISLYWNRIYEPAYLTFDRYLEKKLKFHKIDYKIFKGNVLNEFNDVKKNDNTPFKVFTPFWRVAEKIHIEKVPSPDTKIKKISQKTILFKNEMDLNDILPKKDWYKKFDKNWEPDENEALKRLKEFIKKGVNDYGNNRNIPSLTGTSKLSPFIKHGQIHVETIWNEVNKEKKNKNNANKFLAEIGWREFGHSLINYFPHMITGNYSKKFDKFPWKPNKKFLDRWKKGLTGYPIVDAGMRELYETGWMHNRVRMIVGSFLVKHLLIDWREGEKHFRDCLLDYSEANNVSGWQWVAGCGADAAPYFRIFNPILQGEKFDKEGSYIKKWVPEIKNVPKKFLHKPWEYKESLDFKIGRDYPEPIVNHEEARAKALDAFKKIK